MLKNTLQFLYLIIIGLTFFSFFILNKYTQNITDNYVIYLVFIIVFPFLNAIIHSIKKDFSSGNMGLLSGVNIYKYIFLLFFVITAFTQEVNNINIFTIAFLLVSLLFQLDARVSFIVALILLCGTPLYLLLGDKIFAEQLSIYAYYYLIIGVIAEISHSIFFSKNIRNTEKQEGEGVGEFKKNMYGICRIFVEKIVEIKINMLKEIGEYTEEDRNKEKKNIIEDINQTHLHFTNKASTGKNEIQEIKKENIILDNKTVKIFIYILGKIQGNIGKIAIFFLIVHIIIVLSIFTYDTINWLFYSQYIFIFLYITSLFYKQDITHYFSFFTQKDEESHMKPQVDNSVFINKIILFSSLGLLMSYIMAKHYSLELNSYFYLVIFIIFACIYYSVSDKKFFTSVYNNILSYYVKKRERRREKIKTPFNVAIFITKHIYGLLNIVIICIILITIGYKYGIVDDYKEWRTLQEKEKHLAQQERDGYSEWTLPAEPIVEKIIHTYSKEEQRKIAEDLYKQTKIISDEAIILEGTGSIENTNGENKQEGDTERENTVIKKIAVKEYFTFGNTLLQLQSKNKEVKKLEEIMKKLNYFSEIPDEYFDQNTKTALTNLLRKECNWPKSTKGILGNQAKQCLYTLRINNNK